MTSRCDDYVAQLRGEFPGLRLVYKGASGFSRLMDRALRVVTFGKQAAFMTRYVTTIGKTIYVPSDWDERTDAARYVVLRHEAVHLRQFRRWGLVPMALVYLVPIFPIGLAWGRARLEWEAYAETLRATAEVYGTAAARDPTLHAHIVRQFTSGAYGWMWPFPRVVQGWIDEEVARLPEKPPPS